MNIIMRLVTLLVGRNLGGTGARTWWGVIGAAGYVAGAKMGLGPMEGTVDWALGNVGNIIASVLPGGDA